MSNSTFSYISGGRARWPLSLFTPALFLFFSLLPVSASAQTISSISPNSGPASGGNTVRIFGSGFASGTSVWIWANQAAAHVVNSREVDIQVPPARNASGPQDVSLFSNGGVVRVPGGYTYRAGTPPPPGPKPKPSPGKALSSCADLNQSGSYSLTRDVSAGGTCFFIDADNITLNLNGHTISYGSNGGSRPTPGVLLAANWYSGYGIARVGSTDSHANFEIFGGSIVESTRGPNRSPAIWVGQSNGITPLPKIHDLTLKTYTKDSSPIFGTITDGGWQIYNNNIYYLSKSTSSRYDFNGQAIWLGDNEQHPSASADQIYNNHIYAAPQGGIRDTHQHARIYNNDITFNSFYANDFCVDAPADYQEVYGNNCHPVSGRGLHTNANNVYIHDNTISVQELSQNAEYGGCELAGSFGIQVEFDSSFLANPPTGVRVENNHIRATAGDCDAIGLRLTEIGGKGSVSFKNNDVTTTNQRHAGVDYALSFAMVQESGTNFQFSSNTFNSQHAYVTTDWDGAYVVVPGGQHWIGAAQYSIDDENGANDPNGTGPHFTQSITIDDWTPGSIHCGANAKGYARAGAQSVACDNRGGSHI